MPAPVKNVDVSKKLAKMLFSATLITTVTVPAAASTASVVTQGILFAQLAPLANSVAVLRGHLKKHRVAQFLATGEDQVPGPTPEYVDYGEPQFTTFNNLSSACHACVEFFPEKEDGERFHSALYNDPNGGTWARACRAGKCDFRDPQTEPVGGVAGHGTGPGGQPDGKFCITRDPVGWFSDCEPVVKESVSSMVEVTRYCSYKHQMFIPPPAGEVSRFAGKPKAWARIGGQSPEQCLATIEKQGAELWDDANFCDADLPALSGCCESVFQSIKCVAEESAAKGLSNGTSVFAMMSEESQRMLQSFEKYCVPLCQNDRDEFCEKFPKADICVRPNDCTGCTAKGGLWCPKLKSCHCPGPKPPCIAPPITTPLQCVQAPAPPPPPRAAPISVAKPKKTVTVSDGPLCKYEQHAREWRRKV